MKLSEICETKVRNIYTKLNISSKSNIYAITRYIYRLASKRSKRFFCSYSTYGEDAVLRNYLPEKTGSYLDIGAGNPVHGSNTYFLYKRGWSGILIDPLARNEKLNLKKRPKDTFIKKLVSDSENPLQIYEYSDYQYSHTSRDIFLSLKKKGINPILTETLFPFRLDSLQLLVNPDDPFLLSIDVESHELNVLKSIDWSKFRPRVICVEEWSFDAFVPSEIHMFLISHSYKLTSRSVISNIYLHSSYESSFKRRTQAHIN